MEKVKYSVARASIILLFVFSAILIQQSCVSEEIIGSKFDDADFIEDLSNYE